MSAGFCTLSYYVRFNFFDEWDGFTFTTFDAVGCKPQVQLKKNNLQTTPVPKKISSSFSTLLNFNRSESSAATSATSATISNFWVSDFSLDLWFLLNLKIEKNLELRFLFSGKKLFYYIQSIFLTQAVRLAIYKKANMSDSYDKNRSLPTITNYSLIGIIGSD